MDYPRSVIGDETGIAFPPTIEDLHDQGAAFLTAGFHATGALAADNRVTAITAATEFFGGGMGRKLLLSVAYERADPGLHTDLFVKFPRDFGDPLRDLFGPLMEPECRFALLSLRDDFPIAVPKCYFADYNAETISGILITERIMYGQGSIAPAQDKCMEFKLPNLLGHYRAMVTAMGRLSGAHKAGRLGEDTDGQFPFDPAKVDAGARIPYTPATLQEKLEKLRWFAAVAPQLMEPELRTADFLDRFVADAPYVLAHEDAIRAHLNSQPDYITLCHWNMNLDNAWFWTDAAGEMHAGLLDWGSVGQMNLAQAFYGMTSAGETGFMNAHRQELLELLVAEYERSGGPRIAVADLAYQVKLSVALLGIAWILDAPSLVEAQLPNFREMTDRFDPRLQEVFLARVQLQFLMVFLNEWRTGDIGTLVRHFGSR